MNGKKSLPTYFAEWWDNRPQSPSSPVNRSKWWPSPGNTLFTLLIAALLIFTQQTWANPHSGSPANAPGPSATTVNYQGQLAAPDGTPQNGTFGMGFAIYDAATDGSLIWGPENHSAVPVTEGLFNVGLGSQTSGGIPITAWNGDRYLEITIGGETLLPRELIRSVPIAGMALTVPNETIGTNHLLPGAVTGVQMVHRGPGAGQVTTASNSFVDIPGYEITMQTTGGPVILMFQGTIRRENSDTNGGAFLNFTIDNIPVTSASGGITQVVSAFTGRTEPATTMWIAHPPAGEHTFRIQWRTDPNTTVTLNEERYTTQFALIELKK